MNKITTETTMRECRKHGMTAFGVTSYKDGRKPHPYCRACNVESTSRRRRANREKLVDEHGRQCLDWGLQSDYGGAYDFHHRNPEEKSFALSAAGMARAFEKLAAEAAKCDLLCAVCHRLRHRIIYDD